MQENGSPEEIEEAKASLDEAIAEKQEALTWMHPSKAVQKLSEILKHQLQNQVEDCSIQITKNVIDDAEESLQMINLDKEKIMFYKLINENQNMKYDNFENGINNLDESSDESNNNLPEVQPQKIQERNNINNSLLNLCNNMRKK